MCVCARLCVYVCVCVFSPKHNSDTLPQQYFCNFQFLAQRPNTSIEQIFSSQIMSIQRVCLVAYTGKATYFRAYFTQADVCVWQKGVCVRAHTRTFHWGKTTKYFTATPKGSWYHSEGNYFITGPPQQQHIIFFIIKSSLWGCCKVYSFSHSDHLAMHHFNTRGFHGITITCVDVVLLPITGAAKSLSQNCTSSNGFWQNLVLQTFYLKVHNMDCMYTDTQTTRVIRIMPHQC